jgi:transposase
MMAAGFRRSRRLEYKLRSSRSLSASEESAGRRMCSAGRDAGRRRNNRQFDNRRQVAAYAGLAPTPWQSGSIDHEQGVSKAGNPRLRTTMVELAWLWLKNQPTSALSLWFHHRVQRLGGRTRKTIIVALARKLLVVLWRYTTAGVVIEGAVMKAASATI